MISVIVGLGNGNLEYSCKFKRQLILLINRKNPSLLISAVSNKPFTFEITVDDVNVIFIHVNNLFTRRHFLKVDRQYI